MKKIILLTFVLTCFTGFSQSIEGTWKMTPNEGAMGVGPVQGDTSWWANSTDDVTTRACYFDDEFVFNADGSFNNINGSDTWIEMWQDGTADGCRASVSPHDGSNAATYAYDATANTIILTGVGSYLGLPKAINGSELSDPANAPASVTYTVTTISTVQMTLDISSGAGWWRFVLDKQGVTPTCNDGIMNGNETGIDCGGSCPNVCLDQMDLPVTFEDATVDYGVIGFGDAISTIEANPNATGNNTSNTVVKVIKQASSPTWAGTTITASAELGFISNILLTISDAKMYVAVWSPDANIPVRLKAEDHADATHTVETEAMTTVANAWEVLEFDMANEASGTAALQTGIDNGWVYNKVSIFFNFGTDGATAGEKTYYFDNASFSQPLGIEKNEFSNNLTLYPNPVDDILNINTIADIKNIKVYDLLGKKVKEIKKVENSFINISDLKSGFYILKLESEKGLATKKIVKK